MRPHFLEVTAFGAFAGTVTVDFDDLAASGLFLLHGETGAGKSTLLDALGFALYGRLPGQRAAARRLRSDHAAAEIRTEVRLEATLGGRRMRVTRSPEQERAKVRGTGMTTETPKVLLEQFDNAGWVAVSTRSGEADAEIADRLGMSAEQFFQVILLPQGEFARFLRAPSDERAALLERLFGTDRFRDVEGWLAQRRRDTAAELTQRQDEVGVLVRLIAQIAEVDPPEGTLDAFWATDLACLHSAQVETTRHAVELAEAALALAGSSAEATRTLAHRQRRRLQAETRITELTAAEESLLALRAELERARAAAGVSAYLAGRSGTATDLSARLTLIAACTQACSAERAELIARRTEYCAAAEALPRAERRTEAVNEVQIALAALHSAAEADQSWRERHVEAREGAATLAEEYLRVRRERLDSMVAELAATLHEGESCPVCGSDEHPSPASGRPGRVTADDEDAANAAAEMSRVAAERVGQQAAAAANEMAAAGQRRRDAGERLAALADDALAALAQRCCADADQLPSTDAVRGALRASRAERDRLATQAARLSPADTRITAIDAELAELAVARTATEEKLAGAEQAAQAAGFADLAAAAAAVRTAPWCDAAAEKLDSHRRDVDGTRALLADADLDVALMPLADVAVAEAGAAAARATHSRAIAAAASALGRCAQLDRRVPELARARTALEPIAAAAEQVRALADLVTGQGANTRRMTLSAFVLAARLEEVAAVAGQRLLRMTAGRYTLVHTDAGRDGRRKAGLGLLVRDSWTGTDRDTATLSGGETFMASLALALALADVVCGEAGGTRLDSLFVDEGFGSLDPDSLDEVMDVLDGLREGGRVVGIVSHVAELRARVPAQVHVRKYRHGSELTVVA